MGRGHFAASKAAIHNDDFRPLDRLEATSPSIQVSASGGCMIRFRRCFAWLAPRFGRHD